MRKFLVSLQYSGHREQQQIEQAQAQHSTASQYSRRAKEHFKITRVFSSAVCTHLGVNIGVKGPTAFELFMVYRTLGERGGEDRSTFAVSRAMNR